ncbi:MAG: asparaginase, partial [Thermoprotei archaeon]
AIIRFMLCRVVCDLMARGLNAQSAAQEAIRRMGEELGRGLAGVVAVDAGGGVGYAFNTEAMLVGYMRRGMDRPRALYLHI